MSDEFFCDVQISNRDADVRRRELIKGGCTTVGAHSPLCLRLRRSGSSTRDVWAEDLEVRIGEKLTVIAFGSAAVERELLLSRISAVLESLGHRGAFEEE